MSWSAVAGAAISVAGGYMNSKNAKKGATGNTTSTQQLSPEFQGVLWGNGSANRPGLMNLAADEAIRPDNASLTKFGSAFQDWLGSGGFNDFMKSNAAAQGLQGSAINAPQMQAAQGSAGNVPLSAGVGPVQAAQINAPAQNGTNLNPAFNNFIYGNAAENSYLKGGIQQGIDQSMAAFQNLQSDATRNLTENILPNLRSGAVMNGTYGGSRQALSEGKAVDSFTQQMGRAASQVGQNNTNAAIAAQAGAFNQGQDRALSALGNLNQNQYGTAAQNAGFQQSANSQTASMGLNNNQFNSGLLQQLLMQNLGNQQQANAGNMQSQLDTNRLNSGNIATGVNLSTGLLGQGYNYGQALDNSKLSKLGQISGIMSPFAGQAGSQSTPYYTNSTGNFMGGAAGALGLFNQLGGSSLFGGGAQDTRNSWSGATGPLAGFQVGGGSGGGMFNVSPGSAGDTSWLSNLGWGM